jgi:ribosomal protein L37E
MNQEKKIKCPRCNSKNCFEQELQDLANYLCSSCGFTSNSNFKPDNEFTKKAESKNPQIVNELKFYDTERSINWYPSVISTDKGMIYPEGTVKAWAWKFAPIVKLSEDEKSNYPIPGLDGEYYETRLGVDLAQAFHQHDFINALNELGAVKLD